MACTSPLPNTRASKAAPPPPPLLVRMLGAFDVRVCGSSVLPLRTRREGWLLAILALRNGEPARRDWLAHQLWPDSEKQATWLTEALCRLRGRLGPVAARLRSAAHGAVVLDVRGADIDIVAFDRAVAESNVDALRRAVAIYRGPFMEGCSEPWALAERAAREESYLRALEAIAAHDLAAGDADAAIVRLRLAVGADPPRESAFAALMEAHAACGNVACALDAYHELRRRLLEIGAPVPATIRAVHSRILRSPGPSRPPVTTGIGAARRGAPLGNLPCALTPLVGRDGELPALLAMARSNRLMTLCGPGGVGKTRLALALSESLEPALPDGAWFVELDSISDARLVASKVASAVEARRPTESAEQVDQMLLDRLRGWTALVVLDNCEHLLDECARVAELVLRWCADVRVIATSRRPLGLPGEVVCDVAPLIVPSAAALDAPDMVAQVSHSSAVRLFMERGQAAGKHLTLTTANARAVGAICQRLDGVPMAIELAAARLHSMSLEQIERALDDRFDVLTASWSRTDRHRGVGPLIDWSHKLLSSSEQGLFRRLAVFAGGWDSASAHAVCSKPADRPLDTVRCVADLASQSLVMRDAGTGADRYRLLETTRAYARLRLEEEGEVAVIRDRHLAHFTELAEEADRSMFARDQLLWLTRLETDHDNLRSALGYSLEGPDRLREGLRLAQALHRFWDLRGHGAEGRSFYARAVGLARSAGPCDLLADSLFGTGVLLMGQGDGRSISHFQECLTLVRELGDRPRATQALLRIARVAENSGDMILARRTGAEALRLCAGIGDTAATADALAVMGRTAFAEGRLAEARRLIARALYLARKSDDRVRVANLLLALARAEFAMGLEYADRRFEHGLERLRELGDMRGLGVWLNARGDIALESGDVVGARRRYREGLEVFRAVSNERGEAWALYNLGRLAGRQGHAEGSALLLRMSLRIRSNLNDLHGIADSIESLAVWASLQGSEELLRLAGRLAGAAARLHETIGAAGRVCDATSLAPATERIRERVGARLFVEQYEIGRTLRVEDAVAEALADETSER